MKKFLFALAPLCFLFANLAWAFVDPPWIAPNDPRAGETVYVNIRFGICDNIAEEPIPPVITQNGTAIRIVLWSAHYTDPIQCTYPIYTAAIAFGSFSPGTYTLQVDREFQVFAGGTQTETLGVLPFTVEGSSVSPSPAPAIGAPMLIVLSLFIIWLVHKRLRAAQRAFMLALLVATPFARATQVPVPAPATMR